MVPGGPACGLLMPGDILVRLNGELVVNFVMMEGVLDESVGGEVEMEVERAFETKVMKLTVQDLHLITPSMFFQVCLVSFFVCCVSPFFGFFIAIFFIAIFTFFFFFQRLTFLPLLKVSRAVLHPTSYQQARHYNLKVGSVYVASSGYMFARVSPLLLCVCLCVKLIILYDCVGFGEKLKKKIIIIFLTPPPPPLLSPIRSPSPPNPSSNPSTTPPSPPSKTPSKPSPP